MAVPALVVSLGSAGGSDGPRSTVRGLVPAAIGLGGGPSEADGKLPDEPVRSHRADLPGVARLDPTLLAAIRRAEGDAAEDGIDLLITSGWRSRVYQQDLLDRAIVTYGSREEALRLVAEPDESRHVTGDAVDVGATDAAYWMSQNGSVYGLCQVFANEVWHYELLIEPRGTCPAPRTDNLTP